MEIKKLIHNTFKKQVSIAPLVVFRIVFGLLMFFGTIRFIANGWVYQLYVMPKYYFTYYGFEWLKPLNETGMYIVFTLLLIFSLLIAFGYFYRVSAILFFILFTFVELLDKTNYLNHYYFISLVSFLLMLLPANKNFSLDVFFNRVKQSLTVSAWTMNCIKIQLGIVYVFAGIAKINYDWLINAMPLKIWLPAHSSFPVIGQLFSYTETAYIFSWVGCIFDLTIPFLLLNNKTRTTAYLFVLLFHILTSFLFPIGMFPYIMICVTPIFFSEKFHNKIMSWLQRGINFIKISKTEKRIKDYKVDTVPVLNWQKNSLKFTLIMFFAIQLTLPFRYLLYPGNLFWTEQGYRFSWRVMLMEKAGTAFFYVKDTKTGKIEEVAPCDYLTPFQQKMMATQPDMIVQFSKFIEQKYKSNGMNDPKVYVDSYVTLNGSGSKQFVDNTIDLTKVCDNFGNKSWILPFNNNNFSVK